MLYICILVSVVLRLFFFLRGDEWMRAYVLVFTCLDAFGIGGLFAYYAWKGNEKLVRTFSSWFPIICGLVAYAAVVLWGKSLGEHHNFASYVLLRLFESVLSIAIIGKIVTNEALPDKPADWLIRLLSNRVVVYIGQISYGIYIYHNFVYNFYHSSPASPVVKVLSRLQQVVPNPTLFMLLKLGLLFGITCFIATLSWFLIEKPINKLKERFSYQQITSANT